MGEERGKTLAIQIERVWISCIVEIQESGKMEREASEFKLLSIHVREEISL